MRVSRVDGGIRSLAAAPPLVLVSAASTISRSLRGSTVKAVGVSTRAASVNERLYDRIFHTFQLPKPIGRTSPVAEINQHGNPNVQQPRISVPLARVAQEHQMEASSFLQDIEPKLTILLGRRPSQQTTNFGTLLLRDRSKLSRAGQRGIHEWQR